MFASRLAVLLCSLSPLALVGAARADVLVVAPSGGQYTQIQAAVTAANPGDVVLVRTGVYLPFAIDAKALTVTGDTGATVTVDGAISVVNLPSTAIVVLSGLHATGHTASGPNQDLGAALVLRANSGWVRVEGCELIGAVGSGDDGTGTFDECCDLSVDHFGFDAVRVGPCSGGTSFTDTTMRGGRAANAFWLCWCGASGPGGDALDVTNAGVALYDCSLFGGEGGDNGGWGGAGGRGLVTSTGQGVLASNSLFQGGRGGDAWDWIAATGGDGGDGVRIGAGTVFQQIGCTLLGGAGGISNNGHFQPGGNGIPVSGPGINFEFMVPPVEMDAPRVAREGTTIALNLRGAPGGLAALSIARQPRFQSLPSWRGVLLNHQTVPARFLILGTIPASGPLQTSLDVPMLPPGVTSSTWYLQALHSDPIAGPTLGTGQVLTILDSAY